MAFSETWYWDFNIQAALCIDKASCSNLGAFWTFFFLNSDE